MYRFLTLYIVTLMLTSSVEAQQPTRTGTVSIHITIHPKLEEPDCSIKAGSPTVDFGTVTASESGAVITSSTTFNISGTFVNRFSFSHLGSRTLRSGNNRIPVTTEAPSCECRGKTALNDVWVSADCTCTLNARAFLKAQQAPGTYTGSQTIRVSCT